MLTGKKESERDPTDIKYSSEREKKALKLFANPDTSSTKITFRISDSRKEEYFQNDYNQRGFGTSFIRPCVRSEQL